MLLDPTFAPEATDVCGCACEFEAVSRVPLNVAEGADVSMVRLVDAIPSLIDIVEPVAADT